MVSEKYSEPPTPDLAKAGGADAGAGAAVLPEAIPSGPGGPFTVTYPDTETPGLRIVESISVNDEAGTFTWTRTQAGSSSNVPAKRPALQARTEDGGVYPSAEIAGVRYTTKRGDPNKEFFTAAQRRRKRKNEMKQWVSQRAADLRHALLLVLNPLTFALVIVGLLTGALWAVFPKDGQGRYQMHRGADDEALGWATALGYFSMVATLLAGWWLGIVQCPCLRSCGLDKDELCRTKQGFSLSRLPPAISTRWRFQLPMNMALLGLFLVWAVFVVVVCPVAAARNSYAECLGTDGTEGAAGRRLLLEPPSTGSVRWIADTGRRLQEEELCYALPDAPTPTCGVGSCHCGEHRDLWCMKAPDPPKEVCTKLQRALCASEESRIETSGMHAPLLTAAIGSSILTIALFLGAIANAAAMFRHWFVRESSEVTALSPPWQPELLYHRFSVEFCAPNLSNLVFTLSGAEDPERVATLLMKGYPPEYEPQVEEQLDGTALLCV